MPTEKARPINPRPYPMSPATQALIDLIRPLKIEYDVLIQVELDKPGGGSLKDVPNFREFLGKRLNKTTREINQT